MATAAQPYIVLHAQDHDRTVRVETENEDRFVMTVGAAIQACKKYEDYEKFTKQSRQLVDKLHAWIAAHGSEVREAYMTLRDSAFLFLVVQTGETFDKALEDSISDLDLEIAQDPDLDLIRLNVLALPNASPESVKSFMSFGGASI
jgi:hypothetical protein